MSLAVAISKAFSHAETMAHSHGYNSPEAKEAREVLRDLHETAWEAQFKREGSNK